MHGGFVKSLERVGTEASVTSEQKLGVKGEPPWGSLE